MKQKTRTEPKGRALLFLGRAKQVCSQSDLPQAHTWTQRHTRTCTPLLLYIYEQTTHTLIDETFSSCPSLCPGSITEQAIVTVCVCMKETERERDKNEGSMHVCIRERGRERERDRRGLSGAACVINH